MTFQTFCAGVALYFVIGLCAARWFFWVTDQTIEHVMKRRGDPEAEASLHHLRRCVEFIASFESSYGAAAVYLMLALVWPVIASLVPYYICWRIRRAND